MIKPDIIVKRNNKEYVGLSFPDYNIFIDEPWFKSEAIYVSKSNVLIPKERYESI